MASRYPMGSRKWVLLGLGLGFAVIAAAWSATGFAWARTPPLPTDAIEWVVVRRDDLDTTILVAGDLQPTKQTTVTCQVEDITDSDGTVILSVISNGVLVKKGDELCRLDSSQLEELARQEEIAVEQARADCLRAQLELESARIAFREYQEGLVSQSTKEFEGRIALGQSDAQRQADRLAWTEGMVAKGYLSQSQLLSEQQTLARARHELAKTEGEYQLFRRFQAPKEIKTLQSQIVTAESNHRVEADRLKAETGHLAHLQKQIENCTIRAPHDGVVVYAHGSRWRSLPLEPGTPVYQNRDMFIIPDLSHMEVEISVHETLGPRVRVGMKARVIIASMPDRVFPGRVVEINLLPSQNWKAMDERVMHYVARVRLDKTPPSLLPFMSAMVKIDTGRIPQALVIPVEAMAIVDGQQSCYVMASHGLERRAITTRHATTDLLEITGGLIEGEHVVVRSLDVRGIPVDDKTRERPSDLARDQTASPARPEWSVRPS